MHALILLLSLLLGLFSHTPTLGHSTHVVHPFDTAGGMTGG